MMQEFHENGIHFFNQDCMKAMSQFPDGHFDLAITDPPYGDAMGGVLATNDSEGCSGRALHTEQSTQERKPYSRFGARFEKYKRSPEMWNNLRDQARGGVSR